MSLVEHRDGEDGLVVGILSCSSSGSTMGIEYVVGMVRAVGLLGFSVGLGRRSWIGTCILFVPWLVLLTGWPAPSVGLQVGASDVLWVGLCVGH